MLLRNKDRDQNILLEGKEEHYVNRVGNPFMLSWQFNTLTITIFHTLKLFNFKTILDELVQLACGSKSKDTYVHPH